MNSTIMVLRRNKGILQILLLVVFLGGTVRYLYLDHQETSMKLKAANIRHHELLEERNSFSRQLDIMTQNKADVEYALKGKEVELSKYKEECHVAKEKLVNEGNRHRSQSLTRYNSLESEYQMLKAKNDKLDAEQKHLQQSFDRLKEEHNKIKTVYNSNIVDLKDKHEKVVYGLQGQVEYYQKEAQSVQKRLDGLTETFQKPKEISLKRAQRHVPDIAAARVSDTGPKEQSNIETMHKRSHPKQKQRYLNHGETEGQKSDMNNNEVKRYDSKAGEKEESQKREVKERVKKIDDKIELDLSKDEPNDKNVETNVGNIETNVENVETNVENVETNVENVETNVENVETNVENVETNVENVETNVENFETDVENVKRNDKNVDTYVENVDTNDKNSRLGEMSDEQIKHYKARGGEDAYKARGGGVVFEKKKNVKLQGQFNQEVNQFNQRNVILNNDQKFADNDEETLQEGEENDENAAEGENHNDVIDEHKLLNSNKEM